MSKTVLITGASRGLGAAIARRLASSHHIIAVARTVGALEELDDSVAATGGTTTIAPMDIGVDEAMQQLCRSIFDRWGTLDLWVHTAIHATALTPADHIAPKDLSKSIEINVTAASRLISYVAPLLGNSGQAIFFDDPRGGEAFYGAYGASKAAQIAIARSWQQEAAKIGPKVHILRPDPMPTATRARFHPGEDRDALATTDAEAARLLSALGL